MSSFSEKRSLKLTARYTIPFQPRNVKVYAEKLHSLEFMEILRNSKGPGIIEVFHNLDDETLSKIFKMLPALTVDNLQCDKGDLVVDQPSLMNKDDVMCGEAGPAINTPMQMKESQRRNTKGPGVNNVLVKDFMHLL